MIYGQPTYVVIQRGRSDTYWIKTEYTYTVYFTTTLKICDIISDNNNNKKDKEKKKVLI